METVRPGLADRGRERDGCFIGTTNFLDDMRVDLVFNGFGRDAERVFDRERRAGAVAR